MTENIRKFIDSLPKDGWGFHVSSGADPIRAIRLLRRGMSCPLTVQANEYPTAWRACSVQLGLTIDEARAIVCAADDIVSPPADVSTHWIFATQAAAEVRAALLEHVGLQ